MIWVSSSKDNKFEANSGCKMYNLIQLHNDNFLGKPYRITITIDRDQAQCKATNRFILNIDDDGRIVRIKDDDDGDEVDGGIVETTSRLTYFYPFKHQKR